MKSFLIIILSINFLFILSTFDFDIEFKTDEYYVNLENKKQFSIFAKYERQSSTYLYIYPRNFIDGMNINKAIFKIYFKQVKNKESAEDISLNYLNSDYSSIDFNSGLFIDCSKLNLDNAIIFVNSNENCKFRIFYKYEKKY